MNSPLFTRAFALATVGNLNAAFAEFIRIRDQHPSDPDAHYNVALAQTELGDYEAARNSYREAIRRDRRHVSALHNLALIELEFGHRRRAIGLLERVLRLAPAHPWAALNLSDIHAAEGEYAVAQEILSRALAVQPDSLQALIRLGKLRRVLGDEPGAARVFAEAARLNPGQAAPQTWLGESLRALTNPYWHQQTGNNGRRPTPMTLSQLEDVLYSKENGVARILINRPKVYNAFRNQTLDELEQAFEDANRDERVGVIVLGATGEKAFCTGGDVNEEDGFDPNKGRQHHRRLLRLSEAIRNGGKPVICAVRGYCLGGGNSLMLQTDMTIATEGSKFGQVGPNIGSAPLWWSTQLLPRIVGEKRAREIVYLCQRYTAADALQMGWINKVVPDDQLDAAVQEWCDILLQKSPQALRIAKMSLNYESDQLWSSVVHGLGLLAYAHGSEEFHDGTSAFLEKRKPDWQKFRGGEE